MATYDGLSANDFLSKYQNENKYNMHAAQFRVDNGILQSHHPILGWVAANPDETGGVHSSSGGGIGDFVTKVGTGKALTDFASNPAGTVGNWWNAGKQAVTKELNPLEELIQGKTNIGEAVDRSTIGVADNFLALGTGKSSNQAGRGVRNLVGLTALAALGLGGSGGEGASVWTSGAAAPEAGMVGTGTTSAADASLMGVGAGSGGAGVATGATTAELASSAGLSVGQAQLISGLTGAALNAWLATKVGSNGGYATTTEEGSFAPERKKYQQMLSDLMENPDSVQNLPGYKFAKGQGEQSLDRVIAQHGGLGSGARGAALTKYGQDYASTQFMNYAKFLADLGGAGQPNAQFDPLGASKLASQEQIQKYQLYGQGLSSLTNGLLMYYMGS